MTEKNYNPKQKENKAMKNQEINKETIVESPKEKQTESKKQEKGNKREVPKKTEAIVNGISLPISTKTAAGIGKFIKGRKIGDAIKELELVALGKKAIPLKGEFAHKKGMDSGKYPKKASENIIKILKDLSANSNVNGLEEPIIVEFIANIASRPYGRFGSIRKKRTHVKIVAKDKKKTERGGKK